MKSLKSLLSTTLIAAVVAPLVSAQSLADLPPCAQQAGLAAIQASGCAITNVTCICEKQTVFDELRAAISECSADDQTSANAFANTLCGAAGISSMEMTPAATPAMPVTSTMPADMHTMAESSMPESMMSSMSSDSVAYTAYSGTSTSTTSIMNTTMPTPSSTAHMNMSHSSTSMDMSMSTSTTASPSQYTGGAASVASSTDRDWILPALGVAGIVVLAF
ncbi:hypothetical protein GJ744_007258 [Endocarpon pusillum]|uniref:CFEM domain-containing protein n=1 Tax=Endocarpon pusillum TaxID=364733 RepID=A0A8H7AM74_9EURO|nr:hypothetical protein GJ744_007258 [Endocarpon pusillum]